MYLIDTPTSVSVMPTPLALGTPGWFQQGNPTTGVGFTYTTPDWFNMMQAENQNVVLTSGQTLTKGTNNQMATAIFGYSWDLGTPPGSPITLAPFTKARITFESVATVPLHIACVPGIYRASMVLTADNTTGSELIWKPNDTTYTNAFSGMAIVMTDQNLTAFGSGTTTPTWTLYNESPTYLPSPAVPQQYEAYENENAFTFMRFGGPNSPDNINDIGSSLAEFLVSTFTAAKQIKESSGIFGGPSISYSKWNDTTTAWTSLGTLSDANSTSLSGVVVIERIA